LDGIACVHVHPLIRHPWPLSFIRYAPKPIEIVTPELRKLEITGVFSIGDTEAFLAFLRTLDGVHVDVTATQIRVSKR
jgi:ferric-dicitrate binding protein FerR (iron transport regulator)